METLEEFYARCEREAQDSVFSWGVNWDAQTQIALVMDWLRIDFVEFAHTVPAGASPLTLARIYRRIVKYAR